MYRSHAVHAVNQHRYRQMYPLPMHISEPAGKKKNERYGWFHQKSNEPDVWPKLFHYRVSHTSRSQGISANGDPDSGMAVRLATYARWTRR
jgi:hypothetical protein